MQGNGTKEDNILILFRLKEIKDASCTDRKKYSYLIDNEIFKPKFYYVLGLNIVKKLSDLCSSLFTSAFANSTVQQILTRS